MPNRRDLLDSATLVTTVGGVIAGVGGILVSVGIAQNAPQSNLFSNPLFVLGGVIAFVGIVVLIWGIALGLAHRHVDAHVESSTPAAGQHVTVNVGGLPVAAQPGSQILDARSGLLKDERPWMDPKDVGKSYFKGVAVRLTDFIAAGSLTSVIAGKAFEDCSVYGPAVLMIGEHVNIRGMTFVAAGGVESLLIEVPEERLAAPFLGPIFVTRCDFIGGLFINIGFSGPKDVLAHIRQAGG